MCIIFMGILIIGQDIGRIQYHIMNSPTTSHRAILTENKNIQNQPYESIDSCSIIHLLQTKSKENQRLHNNSKKQLQTEIRRTSYQVKLSRFKKNIRLTYFQDKSIQNDSVRTPDNQFIGKPVELQKDNTFQSFLRKKRVDNSQLKQKMKLFSNTVTDRIKANIEKQISKQVIKIQERKNIFGLRNRSKKMLTSHPEEEPDNNKIKKIKNFTISHLILEKLMGLMMEDPKYIRIKHENEALYKKLKEQMLNLIIRNDRIMKALTFFTPDLKQNQMEQSTFRWSKLKEIQMRRKPFYLLKEQKNDELADQIYKTFSMLKDLIDQSIKDFNKSEQAFQLQQQLEGPIPILKLQKLPKSQKSGRISNIQRRNHLAYTAEFEQS